MAKSRRFRALLSRLEILREHFLPVNFSPIGQYTTRQHDLAKAYVLFVHAEIEAFIEDRARERVKKLERAWSLKGSRSKPIQRLIHSHILHAKQPWQPLDWSPDRVTSAINFYIWSIGNNHGIKEENVCQMCFPLGIGYEQFDVTWLANMSSYGTARGSFAHTSIKTHQPVDPQNELSKVKRLVKGLAKLDRKITALG
jgi:hypothetical protein